MKKILLLCFLFFTTTGNIFATDILVENVFSDINADYKYRDELQVLYDRGTIVPDTSGKFSPDELLNRDEFVGISMEVICERCIQPHTEYRFIEKYFNEDVYFDIDNTNPYFYCVAEADSQNYVRGYDIGQSCQDGTNQFGERPFCPQNTINLEEAVAVLLRNSGIFTIDDNALVVGGIYDGSITSQLGNDVNPSDELGNPYTFYGYLRKALEYEITEYATDGSSKVLKLLELDENGNVNPQKQITKEEFLRMSYIALKSNSCEDIDGSDLALKMLIWDKSCSLGDTDCTLSDLDDPENTYDLEPEVEGTCEGGIDDPTGYIWRFQNLTSGEQQIRYGYYVDDYTLTSPGEWRVYLRVTDTCGNSAEVYSTIYVDEDNSNDENNENQDDIDVDIDVYDDECTILDECEEIDFDNDDDDVFDFDGDVYTSCTTGEIQYNWTFTHLETNTVYNYSQRYIDNIFLGLPGEWFIVLRVQDGCNQTGSEQLTYIVTDPEDDDNNDESTEDDEYIDVDIDVYDDDCNENLPCEELEFENEEDDDDDIFDFDDDVYTSCEIDGLTYLWTFSLQGGSEVFSFTDSYIDDFDFFIAGIWTINLRVTDACGQQASEEMTYIVYEQGDISLNVGIIANPIYGYEDMEVNFQGIVSGGTVPYTYEWDFGDSENGFSKNINHLYRNDGTFPVSLLVTDSRGLTGTATVVILVLDRDMCEQDSDNDGINDCDDSCPLLFGVIENNGCPIYETSCSITCGCEEGFSCSDSDPLTCGGGVCLPDFEPETSCLYTPGIGGIYGNSVCATCPCDSYLDFLADVRRCDLVFPAITSPNGSQIYSRGNIWQVE